MKNKSNHLKSTVSALALSLAISGGVIPPGPQLEDTNPFPKAPGIEEENPDSSKEPDIQPQSNLDDKKKQSTW